MSFLWIGSKVCYEQSTICFSKETCSEWSFLVSLEPKSDLNFLFSIWQINCLFEELHMIIWVSRLHWFESKLFHERLFACVSIAKYKDVTLFNTVFAHIVTHCSLSWTLSVWNQLWVWFFVSKFILCIDFNRAAIVMLKIASEWKRILFSNELWTLGRGSVIIGSWNNSVEVLKTRWIFYVELKPLWLEALQRFPLEFWYKFSNSY